MELDLRVRHARSSCPLGPDVATGWSFVALRPIVAQAVVTTTGDPRLGTQLAGYRIEVLLGAGGMGIVYRAHDPRLKRDVALKLLAPELVADEGFRERFLQESELAASLEHPNVIPIHDVGEAEGQLFIVMRLVEGGDLKRLLSDEGPVQPGRALLLVAQVADALDTAHTRGLVHRDVKPSNVLLDEREHVYLADFGLTRRLGEAGTALGAAQSLGTIDYVAPEQIRGEEVDGRADLYSLGCLLYECLTGEPPFARASDAAVLFAHLEDQPPSPPGLEEVMTKALAKDPDERYQSGRELVEAAREALGIAEPRPRRWPLVAALGLVLVGAALLAFFLTPAEAASPPSPGPTPSSASTRRQTESSRRCRSAGRRAAWRSVAGTSG
jgi:serine/threonine protein kinase